MSVKNSRYCYSSRDDNCNIGARYGEYLILVSVLGLSKGTSTHSASTFCIYLRNSRSLQRAHIVLSCEPSCPPFWLFPMAFPPSGVFPATKLCAFNSWHRFGARIFLSENFVDQRSIVSPAKLAERMTFGWSRPENKLQVAVHEHSP